MLVVNLHLNNMLLFKNLIFYFVTNSKGKDSEKEYMNHSAVHLKLLDEKLMGYFIMDDLAISGARNLLNNFKITERETNNLMPS